MSHGDAEDRRRIDTACLAPGARPRDEDLDVFGLTQGGNLRGRNEDQFLIASLHKRMKIHGTSLQHPEHLPLESERLAFVVMVADGVGGAVGGDEASRAAVEAAAMYLTHSVQCYYAAHSYAEDVFHEALQHAVARCHRAVLARAADEPGRPRMATALTLGLGVWPRAYVVQVGGSRAYLLRDGTLRRLSTDQTLAQRLVDRGMLDPGEAGESPSARALTSAVGGSTLVPVITCFSQRADDAFLFCTAGLTRHVPEDRIRERLLAMTSAEQVCRQLLDDALERGGSDDVTIVVGHAPGAGRR